MEFETFRGKDVAEVMAAVKAAYGTNAWIGPTRHLSNGRSGALEHRIVEVKAAPIAGSSDEDHASQAGTRVELLSALANKRRSAKTAKTRTKPTQPDERSLESREDDSIASQLQSIRLMLEALHSARSPKDRVAAALDMARFEGSLATRLSRGGTTAARKGDEALNEWLRKRIGREVHVAPDPLEQRGRRIVICVGPTGVGKTTTIAKLAARAQFEAGRSIHLMTLDTFRVGSVAQIERFAQLMGAPFTVLTGPSQFCDAMVRHPADTIFIDTASLPPSDTETSNRLSAVLEAAPDVPVDTLLVLPAMIQGRDAERIARSYSAPRPTGLVISKLDEIDRAGGVLHASINVGLPVTYLSAGPRVPEDIEPATVDTVLDTVFPEYS